MGRRTADAILAAVDTSADALRDLLTALPGGAGAARARAAAVGAALARSASAARDAEPVRGAMLAFLAGAVPAEPLVPAWIESALPSLAAGAEAATRVADLATAAFPAAAAAAIVAALDARAVREALGPARASRVAGEAGRAAAT
jgi:hypothetical protein